MRWTGCRQSSRFASPPLSNPHLLSWALDNGQKNDIMDTSCRNELPLKGETEIGWGAQTSGGSSEYSPCSLFFKWSQLRCVGNLIRMPPGRLPLEVFWVPPTGRTLRQNTLGGDYISHLAWECHRMEELGIWNILLRLLSRPDPGICKDSGWRDGLSSCSSSLLYTLDGVHVEACLIISVC